MTVSLVTTAEANAHLRLDLTSGDDREDDLASKMEQATDIVLDYLKTEGSGWDETTVPRPVHAAILITLTSLWDDRTGSSLGALFEEGGACNALLKRFRDPALA